MQCLADQPTSSAAAHAASELEALRQACTLQDDGCAVLEAVKVCAVQAWPLPPWLCAQFIRRHDLVKRAHVGTWDEAFGRPHPKGAQLRRIRRDMEMKSKVHRLVWEIIRADLGRAINRDLFEEVSETDGMNMSGSTAERLYYLALEDGALNLSTWRASELAARRDSSEFPQKAGSISGG